MRAFYPDDSDEGQEIIAHDMFSVSLRIVSPQGGGIPDWEVANVEIPLLALHDYGCDWPTLRGELIAKLLPFASVLEGDEGGQEIEVSVAPMEFFAKE